MARGNIALNLLNRAAWYIGWASAVCLQGVLDTRITSLLVSSSRANYFWLGDDSRLL